MAQVKVRHINAVMADGTSYQVPYWEVRAAADGPRLLVTAAMHGNEVQGTEVLRRIMPEVSGGLRCGTCLFVPMANLMAVRRRQPQIDYGLGRYYGSDNVNNLNCAWPGKADGSSGQRLAHAFYQDLLPQATHLIDLHCYSRCWATVVMARTGNETSMAMARACSFRFAKHSGGNPEAVGHPVFPCIQDAVFNDTGRAGISVEFSGQYAFSEREVRSGVRAVLNNLRLLEMLPGEIERDDPLVWLNDADEVKIQAPRSGLFAPSDTNLGDPVGQGALLGQILSDKELTETPILSPVKGYLRQNIAIRGCGKTDMSPDPLTIMHPFVNEGEVLAVVMQKNNYGDIK